MTTLTIADPAKEGIVEYLKSLPSRNPETVSVSEPGETSDKEGVKSGLDHATGVYYQNSVEYPSPYNFSIYTDYLRALEKCIPEK